MDYQFWTFIFRWLHILSGVMGIGHLRYFNFTQPPTVPRLPAALDVAKRGAHGPVFVFEGTHAGTAAFSPPLTPPPARRARRALQRRYPATVLRSLINLKLNQLTCR